MGSFLRMYLEFLNQDDGIGPGKVDRVGHSGAWPVLDTQGP